MVARAIVHTVGAGGVSRSVAYGDFSDSGTAPPNVLTDPDTGIALTDPDTGIALSPTD